MHRCSGPAARGGILWCPGTLSGRPHCVRSSGTDHRPFAGRRSFRSSLPPGTSRYPRGTPLPGRRRTRTDPGGKPAWPSAAKRPGAAAEYLTGDHHVPPAVGAVRTGGHLAGGIQAGDGAARGRVNLDAAVDCVGKACNLDFVLVEIDSHFLKTLVCQRPHGASRLLGFWNSASKSVWRKSRYTLPCSVAPPL